MDARWGLGSGNTVGKKLGMAGGHGPGARISLRFFPSSGGLSAIVILVLALVLPATSSLGQGGWTPTPFEIGDDDFRMTWVGTDGSTAVNVYDPAMAYNSQNNEFIVVFESSGAIFYRRVDAASGDLIGTGHVQVTTSLTSSDQNPDVAYNSTNNEYLIVWRGTHSSYGVEIWGRRLDAATLAELDATQFRISTMDGSGVHPSVAHNVTDNEYLVVWRGSMTGHGGSEVYGQRLDAATGTEVGTDIRLSQMGPEGDNSYNVGAAAYGDPNVAYNSTDNNYLVVWDADDDTGSLVDGEFEIYGQLVSAAGAEIGTDDLRLSDMSTDGSHYDAKTPDVAYNSRHNEYLVVWDGYDDSPPAPPEATGGTEIWGQRVAGATGAEVGTNDFNISDIGVSGEWFRYAEYPDVAYDPDKDRYLVVFRADDDASSCGDGEYEMHGQFLSGATATDILLNDFRFSTVGNDVHTGNFSTDWFGAIQSVVAYGSEEKNWLVVWRGDNEIDGLVRGEWELFGQFLTSSFADFFIADESRVPSPIALPNLPGR